MIKRLETLYKDGTSVVTFFDKTKNGNNRWNVMYYGKPIEVPIHMMKATQVTIAKFYCNGNGYGIDWIAETHNMVARSIAQEHGGIDKNMVDED